MRRSDALCAAALLSAAAAISLGCGSGPGWGGPGSGDGSDGGGLSGGDGGTAASDAGAGSHADGGTTTPDASVTQSPSLEIVSGDGDTVASGWPATDPLRVRARDGQGNPVVGASVTFAVGAGQSLHLQSYTNNVETTDADGIASVNYNAFPLDPNPPYESDTITASWNGLTALLHVIITQVPSGQWAAPPLFQMTVPDSWPDLGTVKAGSTAHGAIQGIAVFQQGSATGQGVPGWGLRITKYGDLLSTDVVACAGGTTIADTKGNISCDVVVPSTPGDYYYTVLAAGTIKWDAHMKVVP